jgi:hypothetical protein
MNGRVATWDSTRIRRADGDARCLGPGVVWAAILFGVGLRVWILASPLGRADADEAGVGLMARHLLHREFHVFFLGQNYGGSHESFLAGALFAVIGSSVVALKVVPIALHALSAWLLWRIGKRTVGDRAAQMGALACDRARRPGVRRRTGTGASRRGLVSHLRAIEHRRDEVLGRQYRGIAR